MLMDTKTSISTDNFVVIGFSGLKIYHVLGDTENQSWADMSEIEIYLNFTWYSCKGVSADFNFWSTLNTTILFSIWFWR